MKLFSRLTLMFDKHIAPTLWGALGLGSVLAVVHGETPWKWRFVAFFLGVCFYRLANIAKKKEKLLRQEVRNLSAQMLVPFDSKRFSVYLRPFSITGRLMIKNPYSNRWVTTPTYLGQPDNVDLEELLSDVFQNRLQ